MNLDVLTYLFVGLSFALYIGIAIWARAGSTREFYIAGGGVHPVANGMATAADWMSAASFISLAGIVSFSGYDASGYLMGWTGGYVMLAMLLAPYLRKFGKFTVPDFIGDRYYSSTARTLAVICVIFISFTYIAGQMRGTGIVFSRFLHVDIESGILIGMVIVFFYAVMGGMKGITYTQVAQYCILIFAYTVPAVFLIMQVTGHILPQTGLGATVQSSVNPIWEGRPVLFVLDEVIRDLGFHEYTSGSKTTIDMFFITVALMAGTAGLPHVIVRFFTVPKVKDARSSAGWALMFIAILYLTVPAVGAVGRLNLINTINGEEGQGTDYQHMPLWFKNWEQSGLIAWNDRNGDGLVQYAAGDAFVGGKPILTDHLGDLGQRLTSNPVIDTESSLGFDLNRQPYANEVFVDRDIMVLANPEIAQLPDWVIALVAAGAVAAALSTASGLLLVISTAISHDLLKKTLLPEINEKQELLAARMASVAAICIAGYFGLNPPGYVAATVALAFGLAAASFFPVIVMGIFSTRMNKEGAIAGMMVGLLSTMAYIVYFKFMDGAPEDLFLGISPEGFGGVGMLLNFVAAFTVSSLTKAPPEHVQAMIKNIRIPREANKAQSH
ncbi:sodium:solute symporter family protein [Oceanospirillum maris]|uniref:sodium:solute symporter family protein n=1 Tax=Oceanospirillum maris TaxID=64977 RepID=UPI000407DB84|nr:sodium:solute symporter family protein [Oceanospirillum maris]